MIAPEQLDFNFNNPEGQNENYMQQNTYAPPRVQQNSYISKEEFASIWHGGFPGEPSLFEELGIHNTDIKNNLKIILMPNKTAKPIDNNFLVGLLLFCLYAFSLIFLGKVRFSVVYVVGLSGLTLLYLLFYYMGKAFGSNSELSITHIFTALAYCTIPLIPAIIISGIFGLSLIAIIILSLGFITWSSLAATRYVTPLLKIEQVQPLVFVPMFLFFSYLLFLPIL